MRTCTTLPWDGAEITELGSAAARHVVTPDLKLDEGVAPWAGLPALLASKGPELDSGGVDGTVVLTVCGLLASRASGLAAAGTLDSRCG